MIKRYKVGHHGLVRPSAVRLDEDVKGPVVKIEDYQALLTAVQNYIAYVPVEGSAQRHKCYAELRALVKQQTT